MLCGGDGDNTQTPLPKSLPVPRCHCLYCGLAYSFFPRPSECRKITAAKYQGVYRGLLNLRRLVEPIACIPRKAVQEPRQILETAGPCVACGMCATHDGAKTQSAQKKHSQVPPWPGQGTGKLVVKEGKGRRRVRSASCRDSNILC